MIKTFLDIATEKQAISREFSLDAMACIRLGRLNEATYYQEKAAIYAAFARDFLFAYIDNAPGARDWRSREEA